MRGDNVHLFATYFDFKPSKAEGNVENLVNAPAGGVLVNLNGETSENQL
tara:strand:- start:88 stop:234 length:147 start_codon:yes stop_codon:yes gene_type:complete